MRWDACRHPVFSLAEETRIFPERLEIGAQSAVCGPPSPPQNGQSNRRTQPSCSLRLPVSRISEFQSLRTPARPRSDRWWVRAILSESLLLDPRHPRASSSLPQPTRTCLRYPLLSSLTIGFHPAHSTGGLGLRVDGRATSLDSQPPLPRPSRSLTVKHFGPVVTALPCSPRFLDLCGPQNHRFSTIHLCSHLPSSQSLHPCHQSRPLLHLHPSLDSLAHRASLLDTRVASTTLPHRYFRSGVFASMGVKGLWQVCFRQFIVVPLPWAIELASNHVLLTSYQRVRASGADILIVIHSLSRRPPRTLGCRPLRSVKDSRRSRTDCM